MDDGNHMPLPNGFTQADADALQDDYRALYDDWVTVGNDFENALAAVIQQALAKGEGNAEALKTLLENQKERQ